MALLSPYVRSDRSSRPEVHTELHVLEVGDNCDEPVSADCGFGDEEQYLIAYVLHLLVIPILC